MPAPPLTSPPALDEALAALRAHTDAQPVLALVLGSGLGDLAQTAEEAVSVPTSALPGYPQATVAGHTGRLVFGQLEGRPVVFVQGRVHAYEGHALEAVTFYVRLLHALGVPRLLVTNAAGGVNPSFRPGTLMFIEDHINLAFASPLAGPPLPGTPRFPDMSAPYDPAWLAEAEALALEAGLATRRGTYLWTAGPSYETPAEIRFFSRLGADAVGMSTVPEVIVAHALGMRVLGLSTITNAAAGLGTTPLDHQEVLDVGRQVRGSLERLVRVLVRALDVP